MSGRSVLAVPLTVALLSLGCGGEAAPGPKRGDSGGGGQGAEAGDATAGAVAGGGAGGVSAARSGTAGCGAIPVLCSKGCGDEPEIAQVRECQGGVRQCADGFTLLSQCPPDSCLRSTRSCCNPVTGAVDPAQCEEERWMPCPDAAPEFGPPYACIPPQANVSDCAELSGACESSELRCKSGGNAFCGTLCACQADAAGVLHWACEFTTCP